MEECSKIAEIMDSYKDRDLISELEHKKAKSEFQDAKDEPVLESLPGDPLWKKQKPCTMTPPPPPPSASFWQAKQPTEPPKHYGPGFGPQPPISPPPCAVIDMDLHEGTSRNYPPQGLVVWADDQLQDQAVKDSDLEMIDAITRCKLGKFWLLRVEHNNNVVWKQEENNKGVKPLMFWNWEDEEHGGWFLSDRVWTSKTDQKNADIVMWCGRSDLPSVCHVPYYNPTAIPLLHIASHVYRLDQICREVMGKNESLQEQLTELEETNRDIMNGEQEWMDLVRDLKQTIGDMWKENARLSEAVENDKGWNDMDWEHTGWHGHGSEQATARSSDWVAGGWTEKEKEKDQSEQKRGGWMNKAITLMRLWYKKDMNGASDMIDSWYYNNVAIRRLVDGETGRETGWGSEAQVPG